MNFDMEKQKPVTRTHTEMFKLPIMLLAVDYTHFSSSQIFPIPNPTKLKPIRIVSGHFNCQDY